MKKEDKTENFRPITLYFITANNTDIFYFCKDVTPKHGYDQYD